MRNVGVVLVAAFALLWAGCGDAGGEAAVDERVFDGLDLKQRDGRGILRCIALTEALVPIANVEVRITGPGGNESTTRTGEAGECGFDDLEPGPYVVDAAKAGYTPVRRTTSVEADEAAPDILRLVMGEDPATRPYATTTVWDGYLECSVRVVTPVYYRGQDCSTGIDSEANFTYAVDFEGNPPSYIHAELTWENTQTLGSALTLVVGPTPCYDLKYARSDGPSPRIIGFSYEALNETMVGNDIPADERDGVCYRVFAWAAEETASTVGLTLAQKYRVYIVQFHNFEPVEGYTFSEMGEPVPPL